jgi:hypothetical protein
MASQEECDRYATDVAQRFDEFVRWAIANWPHKNFPLLASDFSDSRRELSNILGSKLHDGSDASTGNNDNTQFVDITPAPWP